MANPIKKTVRKVAKKVAPKAVAKIEKKEAKEEIKKSKYILELKLNGETFIEHTDDIEATLMSLKPELVHVEAFVTIHNDTTSNVRRLSLMQARKLFIDPLYREIFIKSMLLE